MEKKIPAKLLLFGEYTVIFHSGALAIPVETYSAHLKYQPGEIAPFWRLFFIHLDRIVGKMFYPVEKEILTEQVNKGLYLHSDIPIGYGLGSSGAFTAAIYDRFARQYNPSDDVQQIHHDLKRIEDFFHGNSSGFDPLVCYMNQPVKKQNDQFVKVVLPYSTSYRIFLINSQERRNTKELVSKFQDKLKETDFAKQVEDVVPLVDRCIESFLGNKVDLMFSQLNQISQFQFDFLNHLITPNLMAFWKESLSNNKLVIKLCGAGGGGFYLAFAEDNEVLNSVDLPVIPIAW